MAATTYRHNWNNLPKSSDFNKNCWMDVDPKELINSGYTQDIDSGPRQTQLTTEGETKSQDINDAQQIGPTAFDFQDRTIRLLYIPDSVPETRNWVTLHALQEWEGHVLNKGDNEFVARLRDLTAESSTASANQPIEEEAIIPLTEIADEDFHRIQPGSVFRWIIGYERAASGTKRRISQIVFRDLPSITEQDKSAGAEWAKKIIQSLNG